MADQYIKSALDKALKDSSGQIALVVTNPDGSNIGESGKVAVESGDTPGFVEDKILAGTGITATQAGTTNKTITISSNAGAYTITSVEQGDVIYHNGTAFVNLHHGTDGQYLKSKGHGANPEWGTVAASSPRSITVTINGAVYVADAIVWVRVPYAMTIANIRLGLQTKGTGTGATTLKIYYHATDPASVGTLFTTGPETNAPTLTSSDYTDGGVPEVTSIAAGGWLRIGFASVCATTPGSNAVIEILE